MDFEHGEISIWSEVKLAIIKEYASTYTKILDAQRRERIPSLPWFYIDGYVGSGHHISKIRGDLVEGSPLTAVKTNPPFHEYHFIDSDTGKTTELRKEAGHRPDVFTFAEAFRQRLEKAGFKFVPRPMAMKTKSNSVIYYV